MRAPWLALAFLGSAAVPLSESLGGVEIARGSHAALALVPWFLLAPFPRASAAGEPLAPALLSVASFLAPPLLLGVGLDLARGAAPLALGLAVGAGVLTLLAWTAAAELGRRTTAVRRAHARLWFLAFPGSAALALALLWAPRSAANAADGSALLAPWMAANPLLGLLCWGRPGGLETQGATELSVPVLCAALALGLVLARSRGAEPSAA